MRAGWALGIVALVAAGCSGDAPNTAHEPPPNSTVVATTLGVAASTTAPTAPPSSAEPTLKASVSAGAEIATMAAPVPSAPTDLVPTRCASGAPDLTGRTITAWYALGGQMAEPVLTTHVARFEAANPGVRVRLVPWASTPEMFDAFAVAAVDDRPDVMLSPLTNTRRQYDSGMFVAPGECTGGGVPPTLANLLPVLTHAYSVHGVLWAAPYGASTPLMMFDRARWQAAGVDPDDPPDTWPELFDTIVALRDSGRARYGAVLYDGSGAWIVSQTAAQEGRLLVEPANGYAGTDIESVELYTDEVAAILSRLSQLHVDGYVHWAGWNEGGSDDLLLMVSGDDSAGLTFHTSASLGDIYDLLGKAETFAGVEVGAAPLPGPRVSPPGGNAWWLTDRDDPAQAAAAWALLEYLTGPAQVAELAAATGYAPTSTEAADLPVVQEAWAERPALRVAYDLLAATPGDDAHAGPQVGPALEFGRQLELAAAYPIDVQDDPAARLQMHGGTALAELFDYHALVSASD